MVGDKCHGYCLRAMRQQTRVKCHKSANRRVGIRIMFGKIRRFWAMSQFRQKRRRFDSLRFVEQFQAIGSERFKRQNDHVIGLFGLRALALMRLIKWILRICISPSRIRRPNVVELRKAFGHIVGELANIAQFGNRIFDENHRRSDARLAHL